MTTSAAISAAENLPAMTTRSAELFDEHRSFLWGLLYRMTGCGADADDLVQETFVRLLERGPAEDGRPLRPWLVRVSMNLAHDLLRRRRRSPYIGPWLPSPVSAEPDSERIEAVEAVASGMSTEGRYDLVESMSMAFLVALEALTPRQRAVLLLRDVFDYSVAETADALGVSEPDVKTTHHRARRAMAAYDRERCQPTREVQDRTRTALAELMAAFARGDLAGAERQLATSVVALSDGGGEFFAARVPIVGVARVSKFYNNVATRSLAGATYSMTMLNGLPAIVTEIPGPHERQAARLVTSIALDRDGRIARIWSVLASRKLTALGAPAPHC
jgi:RNA polymerase sigma-70 factor (ECF subfamily)